MFPCRYFEVGWFLAPQLKGLRLRVEGSRAVLGAENLVFPPKSWMSEDEGLSRSRDLAASESEDSFLKLESEQLTV